MTFGKPRAMGGRTAKPTGGGGGASADGRPAPRQRPARKVREATPAYLEAAGLWYLERFAASADKVRRLLMRKVTMSAKEHGTSEEQGAETVDRLVKRFIELGLIRDRDLAVARAGRMHEKGTSRRMIQAKLGAMGLGTDDVAAALREVSENADGNSEQEAAWALAKRKKLGPYRAEAEREERRQKDMGVLARAGFSFDIARRVIDASEPPGR